jgi:predicted outer membrane repeat protein
MMHTGIFNNNLIKLAFSSTLLLLSLASSEVTLAAPTGSTLYARPGASGSCASWGEACDLQTALGVARPGDEVWVKGGVYYPGPPGVRTASFQLKNGVGIYGGFDGWETRRQHRDYFANPTTLSGDIDRSGTLDSGDAYHVVTAIEVDASAVLDGFTITGGNANGDDPYNTFGGGMVIISSSPTLNNLHFYANRASIRGGGLYTDASSPVLTNVNFSLNRVNYLGGGMYNRNSLPSLTNAIFSGNTAVYRGGGVYSDGSILTLTNAAFSANEADYGGGMANLYNSGPRLTNVTFHENYARVRGGGMYNDLSHPRLTNVTFSTNGAKDYGGGMDNAYNSSPTLTNVTFSGNYALVGGGLYNHNTSSVVLTNTILWANAPQEQIFGPASVSYSIIEGGYPGEGNLNADPMLDVLAVNGGFTPTHALLTGSPAISAGHPFTCPPIDQRGLPRPADGSLSGEPRCDIGAFEFQPGIVYLPVVRK